MNNLDGCTDYTFSVQTQTVENNEKSELSDPVSIQTEESVPSEPVNLKSAGATTSLIKLAWEPPLKPNGALKSYFVYCDDTFVDQTAELNFVLTGLKSSTVYEVGVCASTSAGRGPTAIVTMSTCSLGDITPERPNFPMINKREIMVKWAPPQVITGKLNRYELFMNGKCVYSGILQEYQVSMLRPDCEYRFEVVAITTEGKCKSKVSRARTLKDECKKLKLVFN